MGGGVKDQVYGWNLHRNSNQYLWLHINDVYDERYLKFVQGLARYGQIFTASYG